MKAGCCFALPGLGVLPKAVLPPILALLGDSTRNCWQQRTTVADAIFISYRRDDSEGEAGRLFDDLTRAFGSDAVFMDVAGIKPGADFRKAIDDNVTSCGVFLAIVGPTWATITNSEGKRRLDDPNDFVALELASALKREVPVIPVLVHEAKMPAVSLLPESLQAFAYRNSVELSHARWNSDVALLIEALKAYVTPRAAAPDGPVHATVPVQLPAPHPPAGNIVPAAETKSKPKLIWAVAGVVLIAGVIAYFVLKAGPDNPNRFEDHAATAPNPGTAARTPAPDPGADRAAPPAADAAPKPANIAPKMANSAPKLNSPAAATIPAAVPAPDPSAQFVGTWKLAGAPAKAADSLGELVVAGSASGLAVHAYGNCQSTVCDWGVQPGVLSGGSLIATFSPPPSGSDISRTAEVTARLVQGQLDVVIHNTFQNPAGPRNSNGHRILRLAQ
jgi:hypothetical protein